MNPILTAPLLLTGLLAVAPTAAVAAGPGVKASSPDEARATAGDSRGARPAVIVHRDAGCGCCLKWVDHLRKAGYTVDVRVSDDMQAIKQRLGVPAAARSCHTAEVAGYFVEGHVPVADVDRLLAERPEGRGIATPGMPIGSPGMEVPGMAAQPFSVALVDARGRMRVFATH
ncbi:DUF411 domain-containing protein [Lysobacter humi (ex Lee et al. 2017)]